MKILALGIGNVMFGDEGVGVHLCRQLEQNYSYSSDEHSLDFVDGGTLAQRLIPIIADYDHVIVFDCVDVDNATIGDVYFFDFDKIPNGVTWQGSVHEVEMFHTLSMMDMAGDRPPTMILGVVPSVIEDTSFAISPEVIKAAGVMEKVFVDYLKEKGFVVEAKQNQKDLQSIANESCAMEWK